MPRDTRRRFEVAVSAMRPVMRNAFLQAVSDIKRTADLKALETALDRGDVDAALAALKLGPEFYAPIEDALRAAYAGGANYALESLPRKNPATGLELVIRFQGQHPRAQQWLAREAGNLIVEISTGQRDMAREVLVRGLQEGRNPKSTALDLVGRVKDGRRQGGVIGLTSREAGFVDSYRAKLIADGRKIDQVERMTARYSNKLLLARGERIARTETIAAMNAGRDEGMAQLIDSGEVKAESVTGEWDSTGDGKVRDSHAEMDGQSRPFGQPFQSPSGALLMHPGDTSLGAGADEVINCRCYKAIKVDFLAGIK